MATFPTRTDPLETSLVPLGARGLLPSHTAWKKDTSFCAAYDWIEFLRNTCGACHLSLRRGVAPVPPVPEEHPGVEPWAPEAGWSHAEVIDAVAGRVVWAEGHAPRVGEGGGGGVVGQVDVAVAQLPVDREGAEVVPHGGAVLGEGAVDPGVGGLGGAGRVDVYGLAAHG